MKKMNSALSKKIFSDSTFLSFLVLLFLISTVFSANAQEINNAPEMTVAGVRLSDEESGKAFLEKYTARRDEKNRPVYYFYNEYATEVMKLTAVSEKNPYLIVGAEVYAVGESYRERHFQLNKITSFATESGFFVGVKQSAKSILFGVAEKTDKEKVIKAKGKPDETGKKEKREVLTYRLNELTAMSGGKEVKISQYVAVYEFYKDKLKKFSINIEPAN